MVMMKIQAPMQAHISIRQLTESDFSAYGWVLGKPFPRDGSRPGFSNAATDFWHEHGFDAGPGGSPEILWVNYRSTDRLVSSLEKHTVTQQAIIPLTGAIIHVVAVSNARGEPDLTTLAAFYIAPGMGVCMKPHCWHTTRLPLHVSDGADAPGASDASGAVGADAGAGATDAPGDVSCLMLTRASTTRDLIQHLDQGVAARESRIVSIEPHWLSAV